MGGSDVSLIGDFASVDAGSRGLMRTSKVSDQPLAGLPPSCFVNCNLALMAIDA